MLAVSDARPTLAVAQSMQPSQPLKSGFLPNRTSKTEKNVDEASAGVENRWTAPFYGRGCRSGETVCQLSWVGVLVRFLESPLLRG